MGREKDIERLAELLWRTFKLRASFLVFAIIVLFIARSALVDGDLRATDVDIKFCQELLGDDRILKPGLLCTARSARNYDEGTRWSNEMLSPAFWGELANDKMREMYKKKQEDIDAYDRRRAAAYQIQIQLPSEFPSSSISLNVLSVARVGLFFALILLFLVALWGYQQTSYRTTIRRLVADEHDGQEVRLALSQFFGELSTPKGIGRLKYLVISPDIVATGVLWIVATLLFFAVFFSFAGNLTHLDDSIFFSYPFALYCAAYGLCYVLLINRASYLIPVRQVGSPTRGERLIRRTRWLSPALAALGFLSLLLPWISGPAENIKGYRLLLKQYPLSQIGEYRSYPIDPRLFRELKIQLLLALLFLLVCLLDGVMVYIIENWPLKTVQVIQKWLARLFLFLSLNLLFYMGILEYESDMGSQLIGTGVFMRGLDVHDRGMPLNIYNPAYGFLIFLGCSFLLVWISLRVKPHPKNPVTERA